MLEKDDYLYAIRSRARACRIGRTSVDPEELRAAALAYAREQGWCPSDLDKSDLVARIDELEVALRELLAAQRAFDLAHRDDARDRAARLDTARKRAHELLAEVTS